MNKIVADYYCYWGKSSKTLTKDNPAYHLLVWHCFDVAACGYLMVKENRFGLADILAELGLTGESAAQWIAYLFACHDIGKFARGFQKLAVHSDTPLVQPVGGVNYDVRHDALGYWLWQQIFNDWCDNKADIFPAVSPDDREDFLDVLNTWMAISTGHHGMPPNITSRQCRTAFNHEDIAAATHYLSEINHFFSFPLHTQEWLDKRWLRTLKQQSWTLAGIITLADWLGSDRNNFPFESRPIPLQQYWSVACKYARHALSQLPVPSLNRRYSGHQALFPFINILTPLQQYATEVDISHPGPHLLVCEDVTGAGKTEAAMILTHRLMSANKGTGLYVALPTMATANAMYQRLGNACRALFSHDSRPSLVLAHGGSRMSSAFADSLWHPDEETEHRDYARNDPNASSECHQWFADSAKKSLLAEVGVGTIDQLFMAVMPYRHQSLRLTGMRNKILLLDEVHAYDSYMVRLLEGLLCFHAAQGGCIIILSATLPVSLREKLLSAFRQGAGFAPAVPLPDAKYPWLTHLCSAGLREQPLDTRPEVQRCVAVNWLTQCDQAFEVIYQAAEAGCCICWVRNTVDDALNVFRRLLDEGRIPVQNLMLFHSRFTFHDRMEIEERTLSWFGKESSAGERRGKVLIATQVVEQSLDIDVDCMISDLAPIDLLIQRTGRLQRHIRDACGNRKTPEPDESARHGVSSGEKALLKDDRKSPVLHILAPEWQEQAQPGWLGEELKGTGYVYADHPCLWRTQALLRATGQIRMPEDARALVDGVYEQHIAAPPDLQRMDDTVFAGVLTKRAMAAQNLLQRDKGYHIESSDFCWDDGREFSTRLGEISVDVYLAWLDTEGKLKPAVSTGRFLWEQSRLRVRQKWWHEHRGLFSLPDESLLTAFRQQAHRPKAELVLVSEKGEASYYTRLLGLVG